MVATHLVAAPGANNPQKSNVSDALGNLPDLGTYGHHSSTMGRHPKHSLKEPSGATVRTSSIPKLITVAPPLSRPSHSAEIRRRPITNGDDQGRGETLISKALISFLLFKDISLGTLCLDGVTTCAMNGGERVWGNIVHPDKNDLPHRYPALWRGSCPLGSFISACVEIDEENYSSQVVRKRDPCPHQDCLLCLSTKEEQEQLDAVTKNALLQQWLPIPSFAQLPPKLPSLIGSDQR